MTIALAGQNHYQLKTELDKLTADFVKEHGELALEKIDASQAEYEQILGAVESLPFLATKKMVIVYDLSVNNQASEKLEHIIELAGDSTDLVIVESKPDKRSVYYKTLKKSAVLKEFKEPDEINLTQWLTEAAKQKNASLSRADAQYLVQRIGTNQTKLNLELEKLIQYDPKINRETIDLLTDESPSGTIFNLIDKIFAGDLGASLRIYDQQRQLRVEPQAVHGMLVWQMHAIAIAASAPEGADSAQLAKDSGASPYVMQKSQRIAKKFGRTKIIEFMKLLRDIDYRSKHEALDYDEALRYAIVSVSN